jgi:hypothetical protein
VTPSLMGLGPEEIARRLARKPQAAEAWAPPWTPSSADVRGAGRRGAAGVRPDLRRRGDRPADGPPEELQAAAGRMDPFLETLRGRRNIRAFHEKQIHQNFVLTRADGAVMGQRYTPIERVGVCVPGTPTAFPSTVLMNAIPAVLAGVSEIVMVTPRPGTAASPDAALAAAYFAGDPGLPLRRRPGGGRAGLRDAERAPGGQDRGPRRTFTWPPPSARSSAWWTST